MRILGIDPGLNITGYGVLDVVAAGGARIPLSTFAQFAPKVESLSINHQGQFPAVTLSFNLAPGVSLGEAVAKNRPDAQQPQ